MALIESISLAPVKALRAQERVPECTFTGSGLLLGDRAYVIVEAAEHTNIRFSRGAVATPGHFLSQREDPELARLIPHVAGDVLTLRQEGESAAPITFSAAPDVPDNRIPVSVWKWSGLGVDQGADVAEWLSDFVRRPVRLVGISDASPRFAEGNPAWGRLGFADGYAVTVTSPQAYHAVNSALRDMGQDPLPRNRTRTTLVVAGLTGHGDFPEDFVESFAVPSPYGDINFYRTKACGRCPVPDTDQVTGERRGRPFLAALKRLNRHGHHSDPAYGTNANVFFSQNYRVQMPPGMPPDATVTLGVGTTVAPTYSETTNWS